MPLDQGDSYLGKSCILCIILQDKQIWDLNVKRKTIRRKHESIILQLWSGNKKLFNYDPESRSYKRKNWQVFLHKNKNYIIKIKIHYKQSQTTNVKLFVYK